MKMKTKLMGLLMAVAFLATYMMPFDIQTIWGTTLANSATLTVDYAPTSTLKKGDTFSVQLTLTDAPEDFDAEHTYIDTNEVATMREEAVVTKTATSGTYEIAINGLQYTGVGNGALVLKLSEAHINTMETTVSLSVEETIAASGLVISPNTILNVVAGQTQQIGFTLKNTSGVPSKAGKAQLAIKEKNTSSKEIKLKKTALDIDALEAGESKTYTVNLEVAQDVTRGIHELIVTIDGTAQTIQLKVESNFMPAALELSAKQTDGFTAGVAKDITITLNNVGQIAAKNIKLELEQSDKVLIASGSNVRYIENIQEGTNETLTFRVQVLDKTATTIPQKINLSYTDDLGETKTDAQYIYLTTKSATPAAELVLENIIDPVGTYGIGENFTVKFSLYAKDGAKNVKVSVNGSDGIVPKSKNLFVISEISPGNKTQYSVQLTATEKVTSSTHPIEIKVEYTLNGESTTFSQYATVSINNPTKETENTKKGMPKVIINKYSVEPTVVKAGKEFELSLDFLNTSRLKKVSNLKANFTVKEQITTGTNGSAGSVFTPVGASNTFYISELAPGQIETKKVRLYTIPRAETKTYEITIEMKYEDEQGNEVTETESIGIPVEQVTLLEIAEIQVAGVEEGMSTELTATIYNKGKTDVTNVVIQTLGEGFSVQDNKSFIGKFTQGSQESYTPTLVTKQAGTLKGTVQVEYEDSSGQLNTLTKEFELEVTPAPVFTEDTVDNMTAEETDGFPFVGVGIGILIAAVITLIILKKRKAKKQAIHFDED
jgi:hypothetical protein